MARGLWERCRWRGNALKSPQQIKAPLKFQKIKKGVLIWQGLESRYKGLETFEKLSWPEKAEVTRKFPVAYWSYLAEIREREVLEHDERQIKGNND